VNAPYTHRTVLLDEAVAALALKPDGIYVDCTFGRGGHSRLILEQLGPQGRLIALDKDAEAVAEAQKLAGDPRFSMVHSGFASLAAVLEAQGLTGQGQAGQGQAAVDGVLMDLGISSPQIDDPARGFSFRRDGPLDMRMDTSKGITAAEFLETATAAQIREVIKNYGEERFAVQIAQAIVARRAEGGQPLATTGALAALVADVLRQRRAKPEPGQDPATRTFQALRIYVNQELEELQAGLGAAMDALRAGGRLAVISFHSLEDRMVKQAMRARAHPPEPPKGVPLRVSELPVAGYKVIGKAQRPSDKEVAENPRARSAILRVLERVEGVAA
jgi:16S rRNA (cytosine1402-N4)-methyltransferase